MSEEMTDEIRMGAAHRGGHQDESHGIQALNSARSPLEELMAAEEGGRPERDEVRVEGMRSFLSYLFSDGQPRVLKYATRRLYAVARGYYPELLTGVTMEVMEGIFAPDEAAGAVRWQEPLRSVLEGDYLDVRDETVGRLMFFIFLDEKPSEPWFAMRRVYSLAKSFVPEALDGMSLEMMGEVFGEKGEKSARQRWSARIKAIVVKTVKDAGGVAHTKFSKSRTTCLKYSEAQRGNQNRKKKIS